MWISHGESTTSGEVLGNLFFKRQKSRDDNLVNIASRKSSTAFTLLNNSFETEYRASLPAMLTLLNVDNTEEYIYSLEVSYDDSSNVAQEIVDEVTVIVRVPPRLTVIPERQSRRFLGTNYTLTCNASGDPTPNIIWTKEGLTAAQFNVSGHKLDLVDIKVEDVGSYNCTADNGYGNPVTSLAVVDVICGANECQTLTVGITIDDNQKWPWKDAFSNMNTTEFKMLESNLTSAIASVYTSSKPSKQLYQQKILLFRDGSIVAHVQLRFKTGVSNPLQPLEDRVKTGTLGPFRVTGGLILNPTAPPPTTTTTETTSGTPGGPDVGARGSGLSDAAMWGIIGAAIAVVLIVVVILIVCCCVKKRKAGAGKDRPMYSEADGYRMNKQPPASGLGTASPAYVEARMYAPANAPRRQDDHPPPINYAELSHEKPSNKTPPPRYSTEYSEVSTEKRQGEGGGFELWC